MVKAGTPHIYFTEKEETFCQIMAETDNRVIAYEQAGYKMKGDDGKKITHLPQAIGQIIRKPKIKARIAELRAVYAARRDEVSDFSADWARSEAHKIMLLCTQDKDYASALRALDIICKTTGAFNADQGPTLEALKVYTEATTLANRQLAALLVQQQTEQAQGETLALPKVATGLIVDVVPLEHAQTSRMATHDELMGKGDDPQGGGPSGVVTLSTVDLNSEVSLESQGEEDGTS